MAAIFSFCCICLTGLLFTLVTGAVSIQGSILYIYSVILVYFFGTKLFSKAMSTHTLTFPGKPVVLEILLCETPEFCSDTSSIVGKVGKILVLNIKLVMT